MIGHPLKMLSVFIALFIAFTGVSGSDTPHDKIRVGFFEFDGYHMIDADGVRSGYGYDLLQMLRPYMNCEYEYVGYENGWTDMLPMLEKGEIDFVTSAVMTPEKLAKFDYADMPLGLSSVIMTVKIGHCRYKNKDYANWNGMRVGMIAGNSKNDVFSAFAKEKNFVFHPVYFRHSGELHEALQSENVDAIVTGSLRRIKNELLYEQLDIKPFYAIVKKGNKELLARINNALAALSEETPGFSGELQQLYYGHWTNNMSTVPLMQNELEYVRECEKEGREFTVLIKPGTFPLEYVKDGKPCGVFPDIAMLIAQKSGLKLKLVAAKDPAEYLKFRAEHQCDMIMGTPHSFALAEKEGYILSKPYYPVRTTMIFKKKTLGEVRTVGTLEGFILQKIAEKNKPAGVRIVTCPTNRALLEAVKNDEIDGAYVLAPMADFVLLNDKSGLLTQERSARVIDFSVSIPLGHDPRFVSIIAKCVNTLSKQELSQISRKNNLLLLENQKTFRDFVAENPLIVSLSLIGLVLLMGGLLVTAICFHRRAVKAAALMAKNSRMWKLLVNSLPVQIFAKDASHDFKYVFNNKERERFFGIPAEKMNGMDEYAFLPKEQADIRRRANIKLSESGMGMEEVFLQIKGKDGEARSLYSILVPFLDDDGTKLLLGCSIDQTELEENRRQARENSEWFQKTLISIGDAVLTTDSEGRITLLNPVAEKMLGVTLAECKGKTHTDYFHIVSYLDGSPVPSPVDRCLNAGEIVTLANHTDLISRNGTRYHIADSAAPIRNSSGKIAGAILVFRDVTREYDLRDRLQASAVQLQEALGQAQRASMAKGVFLSQMSHEIRTPLNAIIGYLNIARDSRENESKVGECLDKGLDASSHLLSIINDILDISAIESGKLKIAHEDFDFKHLLTGIVAMFYNQAESRKIKFEMQLRDLTEEWLVGDSLRVNQILLNLLSNSMKFTPAGGSVTLTVKQLAFIRNRVQFMLQVRDTGCGMSEEYKKHLFHPFEQQDASTARKYGGTGLGLSITKNLVTMMDGTIEVKSRENEGTTFTVYLSFERSAKTQASADVDFSRLRALVADDKEEDRSYIQMILTKCGVKSDAVDSGEAALQQMDRRLDSRHPYDLCLLDLRLSGIDGIETARKMRELKGITKDMPIILVTAYDVAAVSAEAHAAGVNKIIQKPLFQSTFFDFLMSCYYHMNEARNTKEAQEGLNGLKIMLVEDNRMNMDISTQYLERAGMVITPAWNGEEAVELFEKSAPGTYQVILMDIQMPVMDGYQATEKIRSSAHPEAKTIPIIAMTANAFNEDVVKALSVGMNDHISKPVFYDRLFASISKVTQKKENQEND